MDKYSPRNAGDGNRENVGSYKAVPLAEVDSFGKIRNKERNSKKVEDMEETPFTDSYKIALKDKQSDGEKKEKAFCFNNAILYFCNFCDNTSIHGFKFLGERGRYVIEKIVWFLIICGAFFGSGKLIYKTYDKWVSSPVVVTFAMTETPIWKIPFPAITICSEISASPYIFNYTDVYLKLSDSKNITDEEEEYFKLFSLICNDMLNFVDEELKLITIEERDKFLQAFAEIDVDSCQWAGVEADECGDWFSHIVTSDGWCRTFNMLDQDDLFKSDDDKASDEYRQQNATHWTLEDGYPEDVDIDTFPRRTVASGISGGLQLELFVNDDDLDYGCGDLQGFKVTLHHPAEEPNMDKHFRVPLNQVVVAGIRPRMITTSDEIRAYDPSKRLCYLPGEKYLSTYKIYTQQNCLTECMTNFTIEQCDCVPFYLNSYTDEKLICGAGSKACVKQAKAEFLQREVTSKIRHASGKHVQQCGCLPSCTSIEFDAETSQIDWEWRKSYNLRTRGMDMNLSLDKMHMSKLQVYYKDSQFMTSERHEFYGTVDFLSNCGGLLGLFCGFSFTSLMEIIYYLTLRLISNLHKFGRRLWSGSDELIDDENDKSQPD